MGSPASLPHLSLVFDQPWSGVGVASCTGLGSLTVRAALEGAGFASARGLALAIGLIGSWSSGAAAFLPHVGLLFGGPVGVLAATGVVSGSGLGSLTTRAAFVAFGTASATGLGVIGRGAQMPLPHLMSLGGASQAVSVEFSAAGRATAAGSAFLSGPFRSPDLLGNIHPWRLKARYAALVELSPGAVLVASGNAHASGLAAITDAGAAVLIAQGRAEASGIASLTVRAALDAAGSVSASGLANLNVATLAANGDVFASAAAALTTRVALAGAGSVVASGQAALMAPGLWEASGRSLSAGMGTLTVLTYANAPPGGGHRRAQDYPTRSSSYPSREATYSSSRGRGSR